MCIEECFLSIHEFLVFIIIIIFTHNLTTICFIVYRSFLLQVYTCRSLRNKSLNFSMHAWRIGFVYDLWRHNNSCKSHWYHLIRWKQVISCTGLQWLTCVEWRQEQEKWDLQPCEELTRFRIEQNLYWFCLYLAHIFLYYNYESVIIKIFPQNYFNT